MNRPIDMIIEGGRVVTGGAVSEATILISGETIVGVVAPGTLVVGSENAERLDASRKIVIPGVIDAHVHLDSYSGHADSFASLSTAAAFGGVTTMIPYIQGKVGMPVKEFLGNMREEGEAQSLIDFAMHCRLNAPERGGHAPFDDAFDAGVTSFKVFMAYRKRGIMWDDYNLFEALEYIGQRGGVFCCHAENGDVIDYLEDKFAAQGRYTPENFADVRPPEAEAEATFRVLTIAKLARCPLYLVHMSTGEAIALAHQARLTGQQVWTETCPQYVTLTNEEMTRQGGLAKIAPPLRERCELESIWRAAADGSVNTVGSDHAAWPWNNKSLPNEKFPEIVFGMPGVETMLPLMFSEGVAKNRIDLPKLVELLCEAPARIFGLAPKKGVIAVGADADLVLIDPEREWRIEGKDMHSLAGYTAHEGWTIRGKPATTVLRGRVMVQEGRLMQTAGFGRYLPRSIRG